MAPEQQDALNRAVGRGDETALPRDDAGAGGSQTPDELDPRVAAVFDRLPGADLVAAGIRDLHAGRLSEQALLVSCARTRLREAGVPLPGEPVPDAGDRLYDLLAHADHDGAHARYNALRRRLVSFCQAAERAGSSQGPRSP